MGISSAVSRGHMRPFGGRSPPFLVATLCVGLCVLAVSYWRLGIQYNDLEEQLRRLIQKKDSLEANESFISHQLELREENFSEAKVNLQKKEQELLDLKKRLDENASKLKETEKIQEDLKNTMDHLKTDLESKETSLKELHEKNIALENENTKLKSDYEEIKSKLKKDPSEIKNNQEKAQTNLDRSQSTNVIQAPDNLGNPSKSFVPAPPVGEQKSSQPGDMKASSDQQHPQEQIQKPKIDPVVDFVKKIPKPDSLMEGNADQSNKKNTDDSPKNNNNNNNNYYHVDEENPGGKGGDGNLDDKDSLLDSNNLDDNNL